MSAVVHHGDCLAVMPTLAPDSVDAIVSDPPYGLAFMGKGWDHAVPGVEFWTAALRVAKPGAYLLAFGGTRTYHRLTCAIEDAGWEIRDGLCWLYGSGFPKSHNGPWGGTALKPAWEPIIMARKPLAGTVAANVLAHGTGALNIDGCRIAGDSPSIARRECAARTGWDNRGGGIMNDRTDPARYTEARAGETLGRWPANVMLDEGAAAMLDDQSGESKGSASPRHTAARPASVAKGSESARITRGHADTGGASRFFYTAKASRKEREAGLDGFARRAAGVHDDDSHRQPGERRNNHTAPLPTSNVHPTVKPLALMRWLCRLVTPLGGLVLDPFAGSGTTGCAAVAEGLRFVGIEREAEYVAIARARIAHHATQGALALDPAA